MNRPLASKHIKVGTALRLWRRLTARPISRLSDWETNRAAEAVRNWEAAEKAMRVSIFLQEK